jgi:hypothetical protein
VPELVLDPNTAPVRVLATLPHFGPTLANRLVEARSEGPFHSLEEVSDRVRGLGPVTLAGIAPYLRIEPESGPERGKIVPNRGDRTIEIPRAPRRKSTRGRKPAATPRQPRLAATRPITSPVR